MTTDLDDLLDHTAARPTAAIDPDRVRAASRRRTARRRAVGGGAGLAVVVAVAVAVPLLGGDPTPVIDDVAGPEDGAVITLDLPDGWTQVAVGDAVFGVPERVEVRDVAADDTAPCPNTDRVSTAHVAPGGWTDGGGCDAPAPSVSSLVAVPASEDARQPTVDPEPVRLGAVDGLRYEPTVMQGPWGSDRYYVFEDLDLTLTFSAPAYDPDLEVDVLSTLAPAGGPAPQGELPDDLVGPPPPDAPPGVPPDIDDRSDDGGPESPRPDDADDRTPDDVGADVSVGEVTITVPDEAELTMGGEVLPCHLGAQVAVLDALTPGPGPDCPAAGPGGTLVALVPADRVAPAFRPGEGDADGSRQVDDVELLGTAGTREVWADDAGLTSQSWWFPDLELHVEVRGAELTPGLVDDLLASATRR